MTPLVWPTVSTVIVLAFVGIFSSSGEILLFTKGLYGTHLPINYDYLGNSDVEQEQNGLYAYDRKPKFPPEEIRGRMTEGIF